MKDVETIIRGVLDDTIAVKDLTVAELDAVLDELIEIGESLLDTENHEAGVAILQVLDQAIDLRSVEMSKEFEAAIIDAEARGSVYFEFEEYLVH